MQDSTTMFDDDLSAFEWRTSGHSGGGNDCVEVAMAPAVVGVRDSKQPAGGVLSVPMDGWRGLLRAARTGHLDLP